MIINISIAIISLTFVVLATFIVITLVRARKVLKSVKQDLHHVSIEAVQLMQKLGALTTDLKDKSESLDCLFHPLKQMGRCERHHSKTLCEVVDWVSTILGLIKNIKMCVREHEKENR